MPGVKKIFSILSNPSSLRNHLSNLVVGFLSPKRYWDLAQSATWNYGKAPGKRISDLFPGIQNIDIDIRRGLDRSPSTSVNMHELAVLCALAKFTEAKNILEIGTFRGNTTLNLAVNTPQSTNIKTVDLPDNWSGEMEISEPRSKTRGKIGIQFRGTGYTKRITQIYGDSTKIDWKRMGSPFDFVFIDGCHLHDFVVADTENAFENVKKGGVILWHDYGMIEDVSRAVDRFGKNHDIHRIHSTRLALTVVE